MTETEKAETWKDFRSAVNMPPGRLEKWLETEESKRVGWKGEDGDSVGHRSGRHIFAITRKRRRS